MVIVRLLLLFLIGYIPLSSVAAIQPALKLSTTEAWQRQEVTVSIEIHSADKFATIKLPLQKNNRYEWYTHPVETRISTRNNTPVYRRILRLSVFFYAAGKQNMQLPGLQYIRGGRIQKTIALPPLTIKIKPLPVYVPPDMPVGEVRLTVDRITHNALLLFPDRLSNWQLTFQGVGVATQWLPRVLRLITNNNDFRVFRTSTELDTAIKGHRLIGEKTYQIPFAASHNGILHLPVLRWQYFDPTSGKIINRQYTPDVVFVTGWLILLPGLVLMVLFTVWFIRRATCLLRELRHRYQHRKLALQTLRQAKTHSDIRDAMRIYARAYHWPENTSVFAWLSHFTASRRAPESLKATVQQLDTLLYARPESGSTSLAAIRNSLLEAI
jgi:hypothetical protein